MLYLLRLLLPFLILPFLPLLLPFPGSLGTLYPFCRASDKPIAIACFLFFTVFPPFPLFSFPLLYFLIAPFTVFCEPLLYLLMVYSSVFGSFLSLISSALFLILSYSLLFRLFRLFLESFVDYFYSKDHHRNASYS